ncbi:MAG: hypothetical protein WBX01_03725 [Nitrososphaeraceae archaeon]|jgi:hypothetical protein
MGSRFEYFTERESHISFGNNRLGMKPIATATTTRMNILLIGELFANMDKTTVDGEMAKKIVLRSYW